MILILGGHGMLGTSFASHLKYRNCLNPTREELDVTNELLVRKYIKAKKPTWIINCTAMRSVDGCEKDPELAYRVNCQSVHNIVNAAKSLKGGRPEVIHISTDYVFDGTRIGFHIETDPTNPVQVYGKTKLEGEAPVLSYGGFVFRVQWLFGQTKENFIDWTINALLEGKELPISTIQKGSPSSTEFVSSIVLLAMLRAKPDLYHVGHENSCTRWECAEYLATRLRKVHRFKEIDHCNFGVATRPVNTTLHPAKLRQAVKVDFLGTWQDDIDNYLKERGLL